MVDMIARAALSVVSSFPNQRNGCAAHLMFFGSIPALVTPFAEDGAFDERAFRDLVEWQIAEGSSALVACGTTGEAATMPAEEHFRVVRICR